ncbi:hypothetical protein KR222_004184, partial [Zaprionus bogoriensis]
MSLPQTYATDDEYFSDAVEFLYSYSWIYREANTSCLKSLDYMPQEFKDYFIGISNRDLNNFPFAHKPLEACPASLHSFRRQISTLTSSTATTSATVHCTTVKTQRNCKRQNQKISQKKLHEVEQLATNIHEHCTDTKILLDLGSGLGYLSEALLKLNNTYLILGLEADEKRVYTARKRIERVMPKMALDSISYRQQFVTADANSRANIVRYLNELTKSSGTPTVTETTIIGLHACADLSISAMLLFLAMPQVRRLHIMPCCYHKLTTCNGFAEGTTITPFVNFPLSSSLQRAMNASADPSVLFGCFNRPFMRLACQETKSRWHCDSRAHADHGLQMFLRAVGTAICDPDEMVQINRSNEAHVLPQDWQTFDNFKNKYQLHCKRTGHSVNWRCIHEFRFNEIIKKYPDGWGFRLAEALCCLQASIQELCENLVLYDRLCYLKEAAARQKFPLEVHYEKLFDEQVSPRCHVLVAKKL